MAWYHTTTRLVPSPQELSGMPSTALRAEITNIELVLANRYAPNGAFAELCDGIQIDGRAEQRAFWADLTRYRANLYMALNVQSAEGVNGGIGLLKVRTNGQTPGRSNQGFGW